VGWVARSSLARTAGFDEFRASDLEVVGLVDEPQPGVAVPAFLEVAGRVRDADASIRRADRLLPSAVRQIHAALLVRL
jgi:hypothetical protein